MTEPRVSLDARFTAQGEIACELRLHDGREIADPVLCFSLLDRPEILSGGEIVEQLGGFCALRLHGRLRADTPLRFRLRYAAHGDKIMNRAWLPLGAYLRCDDGPGEPVGLPRPGVRSEGPARPVPDTGHLRLVPPPSAWQPAGGTVAVAGFVLENRLYSEEIRQVDDLARRTGLGPFLRAEGLALGVVDDPDLGAGAHVIDIAGDRITLRAADATGARHAAITLLNLLTTHERELPLGRISDAPRFSWRGQHLDCARHYYDPATILRLLDLMALLKLNVFHWHFADDEAFRLEVRSHPELWRRSAFRGEGQTLPGLFGGGAGPTGGSYGPAAVRAVLDRARDLGIDVLPEIEFPAHALATTRIYPDLRDPADTGSEVSVQGYARNTVNPALPRTWDFIESLSAEVAGMFPFAHLHVGGDELPPGTWDGSPEVDRFKRQHGGLRDGQDVQGIAMARLGAFLTGRGIRPCAWEEAALGRAGGIGKEALLFSWTGQGPGLEAARAGYDVVMCPGQHVYLDMAHSADAGDWGASWAGIIGLKDTVAWDPVPENEPELEARIAGIEGAFWSEFTTSDTDMEPMLAPRILGVAAKAWSPRDAVDGELIAELALAYAPLFDRIGWDWNRAAV